MRLMSLCAIAFLMATSSTYGQQQSAIDIIHYRIAVGVTDNDDKVEGEAVISFKRLRLADRLILDLTGEAAGKGMKVESVLLNGNQVKFTHESDKLAIDLPSSMSSSDTGRVSIKYAGIPSDGLIISKNKFGNRTFFSDNWPNRAHYWMPCVDEPADKATVEFLVSAPSQYQVVSNGLLQEEVHLPDNRKLTHWKEETKLATKIMAIGIGAFDVQLSGTVDGIPVYSWVYPENSKEGFHDYALAAQILPYYIRTYGPYGYPKLANVQSKTRYGGVENAGTIFYSETSVTGTRKSEALLAHEIAHQWFGDMATETKFAHLWLSEGFATYMTALYMKNKYGRDTFLVMLKKDRLRVTKFAKTYHQPVVDTSVTDYMKLLNANSYQKGGWVLHMLRTMMGDSSFYRSIRKYYATYSGKNAGTDDLRRIMEEVSGKKLQPFFQQWLYTPGNPELDVTWMYKESEKQVYVTVIQKQSPAFQFPLQILFKNAGVKDQVSSVQVSKQQEVFKIRATKKPDELILDPETVLLFEGTVH
ncbi:MAG TPA: M1 family metallopeptidase [Flavitalea sp.]|nr:M1 family metallopeptidase [Flavitalea sp.]